MKQSTIFSSICHHEISCRKSPPYPLHNTQAEREKQEETVRLQQRDRPASRLPKTITARTDRKRAYSDCVNRLTEISRHTAKLPGASDDRQARSGRWPIGSRDGRSRFRQRCKCKCASGRSRECQSIGGVSLRVWSMPWPSLR